MFWVPKKSFYGEWMRKRDFWWEIVAAVCLSLSCPRLPIATFIDGFNTVFHLGLSWCVATLILGLYFNFCFIVYVVRKRHRLLGAPSPHVLLQGNLKKRKKKRERKKGTHWDSYRRQTDLLWVSPIVGGRFLFYRPTMGLTWSTALDRVGHITRRLRRPRLLKTES